jgi:hypothetical protein
MGRSRCCPQRKKKPPLVAVQAILSDPQYQVGAASPGCVTGSTGEPASRPDAAPDKPAAPCGTVVGSTKLGSVSNTAEASTFAVARGRQLHGSTEARRLKIALDVSERLRNLRNPSRSTLASRHFTGSIELRRRARAPSCGVRSAHCSSHAWAEAHATPRPPPAPERTAPRATQ